MNRHKNMGICNTEGMQNSDWKLSCQSNTLPRVFSWDRLEKQVARHKNEKSTITAANR